MRKCQGISLFLLFLCLIGKSQDPPPYPVPDTGNLPGALFGKQKNYNKTSLFGYIDGGAELYLEYGFTGAWVGEIQLAGSIYLTEIYRMTGPEEAFGVFSVSRYHCKSTPPLSPFTCHTPYQLQICSGPFYISIINSTGNSADSAASLKIGEAITGRIKEDPADVSVYLPGIPVEIINHKAVLVKGNLGLMNGMPDMADYLGEASGYTAVILPREEENLLSVRFPSAAEADAFATLHERDITARIAENHLLIKMKP